MNPPRRLAAAAAIALVCRAGSARADGAAPPPAALPTPIREIVADLKADPSRFDVVAEEAADFIWSVQPGDISFIDNRLRRQDLSLGPGRRVRDLDRAAVRDWAKARAEDAAILYFALHEDDRSRAKLVAAMARWAGKTQETVSLAPAESPDGRARDVAVGPRREAQAPLWRAAFLADAVRRCRRFLSIGQLHPAAVTQPGPGEEKVVPGELRRWRWRKRPSGP